METEREQNRTETEQKWNGTVQIRMGLYRSEWKQNRNRMGTEQKCNRNRMETEWKQNRDRTERKQNRNGTETEKKWNRNVCMCV